MKMLNNEIFIDRAIKKHNNKYNYSLVNYVNSHKKIKIICHVHGIFEQLPYQHLNGHGCSDCSNCKPKTINIFVNESIKIHGDRYDYSLVDYISRKKKIKIICKEHGVFEQQPCNHLKGCNCPKCAGRNITFLELVKKFEEIHGSKYEYFENSFIGKSFKLKIRCKLHNYIFYQYIDNHLKGWGCTKCSKRYNYTNKEFIKICEDVHNHKYDYSLTNYTVANSKIKIICSKHGVFEQRAKYHISGHGCPICRSSKGELIILDFLKDMKIKFESQKRFKNCRDKYTLPFDFYLPKYKMCIEYQGRQHFDEIIGWGGYDTLKLVKKHDEIKINFCKSNSINLLIINHDNDIISILKNNFGLR